MCPNSRRKAILQPYRIGPQKQTAPLGCRRSLIRGPVPLFWTGALIRGPTWNINPPEARAVGR
jgi:hypothetical protein